MASPSLLPLFSILLLLFAVTVTSGRESKDYSETVPFPGHNKTQKLTHLHFYLHDIASGANTTAVNVFKGQVTNSSSFGYTNIVDEILTEGPDLRSKEIGRAQGLYTSADMNALSLMIAFNFLVTDGEYNGSTFAMFGRYSNPLPWKIKEMAIMGGTGAFRFARGYGQIKTYKADLVVTVVEYNVYIWH